MITITWGQYIGVVVVLVVLYYSTVLLIFRRKKSKKYPTVSGKPTHTRVTADTPADRVLFQQDTKKESILDAASAAPMHSLVDELQAYVAQAGQQQLSIDEVKTSLQSLLQKYPGIPGSIFQSGISNLIEVIVETHCGYRLSADELSELWTAE